MTEEEALLELRDREPIFHRPELGSDYASLVTNDFWEIGASGKVYSREFVMEGLAGRLRIRRSGMCGKPLTLPTANSRTNIFF